MRKGKLLLGKSTNIQNKINFIVRTYIKQHPQMKRVLFSLMLFDSICSLYFVSGGK